MNKNRLIFLFCIFCTEALPASAFCNSSTFMTSRTVLGADIVRPMSKIWHILGRFMFLLYLMLISSHPYSYSPFMCDLFVRIFVWFSKLSSNCAHLWVILLQSHPFMSASIINFTCSLQRQVIKKDVCCCC